MVKMRSRTILLLTASALLLILLGMSLSNLKLAGGNPVSTAEEPEVYGEAPPLVNSDIFMIIIYGFLALGILFLPFYIIQVLSSKEGRKRLLIDLIIIVVLTVGLQIMDNLEEVESVEEAVEAETVPSTSMNTTIEALGGEPLPELPEQAPQWLTILILVAIAVIIGGLVWLIRTSRKRKRAPLDNLAQEAQAALDSLRQGEDLRSVILRTYAEMNREVKDGLGYERRNAMTARDFENVLQKRGLPAGALHTLTRLFEQARYSTFDASPADEEAAITCLVEIVNAVTTLAEAKP